MATLTSPQYSPSWCWTKKPGGHSEDKLMHPLPLWPIWYISMAASRIQNGEKVRKGDNTKLSGLCFPMLACPFLSICLPILNMHVMATTVNLLSRGRIRKKNFKHNPLTYEVNSNGITIIIINRLCCWVIRITLLHGTKVAWEHYQGG